MCAQVCAVIRATLSTFVDERVKENREQGMKDPKGLGERTEAPEGA